MGGDGGGAGARGRPPFRRRSRAAPPSTSMPTMSSTCESKRDDRDDCGSRVRVSSDAPYVHLFRGLKCNTVTENRASLEVYASRKLEIAPPCRQLTRQLNECGRREPQPVARRVRTHESHPTVKMPRASRSKAADAAPADEVMADEDVRPRCLARDALESPRLGHSWQFHDSRRTETRPRANADPRASRATAQAYAGELPPTRKAARRSLRCVDAERESRGLPFNSFGNPRLSPPRFLLTTAIFRPLKHRELFERRPITATRRTKRGPHEKRAFGDASRADASRDAARKDFTRKKRKASAQLDKKRRSARGGRASPRARESHRV